MTTDLMTNKSSTGPSATTTSSAKSARDLEPTVQQILARARTNRPGTRGAWICGGATALLLWLSFAPVEWGFLGWIALVPLLLLARIEQRTAKMYRTVFLTGFAYSLATLQWMRLGDASMFPAWFALAFYLALYFPVFLGITRIALHRYNLPLVAVAPVAWVGLEYFRAHLLTGFAWYYLGHTQYRWLELIQISDLVGAYGVSFLVAMSSAVLASLVPARWFRKLQIVLQTRLEQGAIVGPKRPFVPVAVMVSLLLATLTYGFVRRSQAEFQPGPRIALIQGNFVSSLKHDPNQYQSIFRMHDALTGMSVEYHPDLIVWPETMFRWPLTIREPGLTDEQLIALAPVEAQADPTSWLGFWNSHQAEKVLFDRSQAANAAFMIGIETYYAHSDGQQRFNSAVFVDPTYGVGGRYDKVHRVPFGEYIPLKDVVPGMHALTPFSEDFGIEEGESFKTFRYKDWTFAPIICFEDTVPHVVREAAMSGENGTTADCLVNVTNDGWFHGSSELNQHLITSIFRAVECRTPLVRAVNTGISAFIDGDGAIVEPEVFVDGDDQGRTSIRDERGRFHKSMNALLVHEVPLDPRESLYLRGGDWFAAACGFAALFLILLGLIPVRRPTDVTLAPKDA